MSEQLTDPATRAAFEHAERTGCTCADGRPRWRACTYHEGYEDGFDAALLKPEHIKPATPEFEAVLQASSLGEDNLWVQCSTHWMPLEKPEPPQEVGVYEHTVEGG